MGDYYNYKNNKIESASATDNPSKLRRAGVSEEAIKARNFARQAAQYGPDMRGATEQEVADWEQEQQSRRKNYFKALYDINKELTEIYFETLGRADYQLIEQLLNSDISAKKIHEVTTIVTVKMVNDLRNREFLIEDLSFEQAVRLTNYSKSLNMNNEL